MVLLVEVESGGQQMCFRTGDDQRGSEGTSLTKNRLKYNRFQAAFLPMKPTFLQLQP